MDPRIQQNRRVFFSEQNEQMIYGMLYKNFQQRLGSQLNDKQASRLERAVEHYMSEVYQVNPSASLQVLNKEVISATASDFNDYIQRQDAVSVATPQMFQESSDRFDQLQQERQRSLESPRPTIPDYIQSVPLKEDESVSALSLFEEAKKRRNNEMNAQAETQIANRIVSSTLPLYTQEQSRPDPKTLYDSPLDLVIAGQQLSGKADVNPTIANPGSVAQRGSLQQDMIIKQESIQTYKEIEYNLSVYSADRNWEVTSPNLENRFNFTVNLNSGNSPNGVNLMPKGTARLKNIVRIEFVKAVMPIEVTDMIVRKTTSTEVPDMITTVASAMAISLATVNNSVGIAPVDAVNLVAANLLKLEQNNAILSGATFEYDSIFLKTVYEYPFVTLNVDELDTNNYGTNNSMDNAFGILQYDSNWTDNTNSLGFTSLIPKHMKCQRVYSPTPLATLNKLTIRLQQPNGSLINSTPDTLDISGIFLSSVTGMRTYFNNKVDISGTPYTDSVGEYIWLDCAKWFGRYQVSIGDTIQIKNLVAATPSVPITAALTNLISYLQNANGLHVVGTGYTKPVTPTMLTQASVIAGQVTSGTPATIATSALINGCNAAGYSRFLILRGQFNDPTTGSVSVLPYGGMVDNSALGSVNLQITKGRLINISRQIQLIFRVITREYDSISLIRSDNL